MSYPVLLIELPTIVFRTRAVDSVADRGIRSMCTSHKFTRVPSTYTGDLLQSMAGRRRIGMPRSREDAKILWVDDTEVVCHAV